MSQPLFERLRPASWAEIIAQPKILTRLSLLRQSSGLTGRAFWITGASGTGKTTIARLLAKEVAGDLGTHEMDAGELTPSYCRELEQSIQTRVLTPPHGRAVIINEAHGLRADTIRRLLVALESIPSHAVWIFTTTSDAMADFDGVDSAPLLSRCVNLPLSRQSLAKPFANYVQTVGNERGLVRDGFDMLRYVQSKSNNLRAALCGLESGECL